MLKEFLQDLKNVYSAILEEKDEVDNFINRWEIEGFIGEFYEKIKNKEERKTTGSFYTPIEVVDYMVDELVNEIDNLNQIKILDPSCGGGYFLIRLYQKLASIGFEPNDIIKSLYGYDIDDNAIMITTLELFRNSKIVSKNILKKDFLIEDNNDYDFIIGNPPYLGHKMIDKQYRQKLNEKYKDVFQDKADLSYCFIKKSIDSLKDEGSLLFFTSRYLLEALYGDRIRQYILKSGFIDKIIDFYGIRFVKGAGVDTIIIDFVKGRERDNIKYYRLNKNAKLKGQEVFNDITYGTQKYSLFYNVNQNDLNKDGWIFVDKVGREIINKIRGVELATVCQSFQGIITGCDKAFIVKEEDVEENNIEKELLKRWIKNSNIDKFKISNSNEYIIYINEPIQEDRYPNAIKYIEKHREKLEQRRECKNGVRKWYQLQWGRKREDFEGEKIIYPYKSDKNRFAIDKGSFYSADVYSLKIDDMFKGLISYEFLVGVLNSRIYDYYIKTMAKKLGDDLYEYYPNKILKLKIPNYISEIDEIVREDIEVSQKLDKIDCLLCKHFGITEDEYQYIKNNI